MTLATPAVAEATRESTADLKRRIRRTRLREWLEFDCAPARWAIAWAGVAIGATLLLVDRLRAYAVLTKVHRANFAAAPSRIVERLLRDRPAGRADDYQPHRLSGDWQHYLDRIRSSPLGTQRAEDPERLLGLRILALKSPSTNERGVLVLDYAYVFPAFLKYFDVQRVMDQYYVVLEPSWTGYANLDLLTYSRFDTPVFIQAAEPRDTAFLTSIRSNLRPVPIAANWWVDHRVFRPLGIEKDVDLIMVASWAPFKRHERVFAALAALRQRGHVLRMVLVGYANEQTAADIWKLARFHGVSDQVELFEGLTPEQVNHQYNRARANLLWSRREGCNRAIIEGMFADVPCIVRRGFNYGYRYDYTNADTAVYADERSLADTMLDVCRNPQRFRPRAWVADHMTCQHAAAILNAEIRQVATTLGEAWTNDLVVKHSELGASRHWNPEDAGRFEADYRRLAGLIRK